MKYLLLLLFLIPQLLIASTVTLGISGYDYDDLSEAISALSGGDTLLVYDGTWTESITSIPSGSNGDLTYIICNIDGGAIIDGEWSTVPINISGDYIQVEGFTVRKGNGNCINISGDNNVLKRIGAMSVDHTRYAYLAVISGNYNLMEDCFIWGSFRCGIQVTNTDNTLRRCVIRMDAAIDYDTSPRAPYGIRFYNQNQAVGNCIVENCIILDSPSIIKTDNVAAGFRVKSYYDPNDNVAFYGCIVLNLNQTDDFHGFYFEETNHKITNCVVYEVGQDAFYNTDAEVDGVEFDSTLGASYGSNFTHPDYAFTGIDNKDGISGINYLTRPDEAGDGATIEKRYVNGVLTDDNLWPFPYETRIKSEMSSVTTASNYLVAESPTRGFCAETETLTNYIWNYLGNGNPYNEGASSASQKKTDTVNVTEDSN